MFQKVFIEEEVLSNQITQNILTKLSLKNENYTIIDKLENYFGKVKKPYLEKRYNLNLFIGEKKGQIVKEAPDAYGVARGKHYYFIHAYNCIYECKYCYLQGYFSSPDIVLYVNHDEIIKEIKKKIVENKNDETWFHAGEFSDSLALSYLTEEWSFYWDFFSKQKNTFLELRTKSAKINSLLKLPALKNVIISFSISPKKATKDYDLKTPSLSARLNAMQKLTDKKFLLGIHLDPIIIDYDEEKTIIEYEELIEELTNRIAIEQMFYFSIGGLRFPEKIYRQVKKNYPNDLFWRKEMTLEETTIQYIRPKRMKVMKAIKNKLIEKKIPLEKIYFCMEN